MAQMSRETEECSRSWHWKLEKPVFADSGEVERRYIMQQVGWSKSTGVSAGMIMSTTVTPVEYDDRYTGALPFKTR